MTKITLDLVKAAGLRALKTIIQTFVASIAIGQTITEVSWLNISSIAFVAGLISFLQNILSGLPEAATDGVLNIDTTNPSKTLYNLELDNLDNLENKKSITFKVKNIDLSV